MKIYATPGKVFSYLETEEKLSWWTGYTNIQISEKLQNSYVKFQSDGNSNEISFIPTSAAAVILWKQQGHLNFFEKMKSLFYPVTEILAKKMNSKVRVLKAECEKK